MTRRRMHGVEAFIRDEREAVLLKSESHGRVVLSLKRCWSGYVLSASEEGRELFSWFTTDLEDALAEFRAALTKAHGQDPWAEQDTDHAGPCDS